MQKNHESNKREALKAKIKSINEVISDLNLCKFYYSIDEKEKVQKMINLQGMDIDFALENKRIELDQCEKELEALQLDPCANDAKGNHLKIDQVIPENSGITIGNWYYVNKIKRNETKIKDPFEPQGYPDSFTPIK